MFDGSQELVERTTFDLCCWRYVHRSTGTGGFIKLNSLRTSHDGSYEVTASAFSRRLETRKVR
jgi:hypothetical protein